MGVNGLWQVLHPCARPTNLATLNRKRLAVDASIWIYQFLKAVRDKDGNALRNSHVVGFFRRICKLLWFGIKPVFVFDGGAPALKRQTIQNRKHRREGRREDAVRTAGKLLAVQMQRLAEEEVEKGKRRNDRNDEDEEAITDPSQLVYVAELGMSKQERMRSRKFQKQDAYHLPDLDEGVGSMGRTDDPRIMSIEELEEYARQFNSGEDINLYDFSKIDFDGEFFKSLPPPDRYNILNAARLRSRLRMGLTKDQLEEMFPDRMAFSRFQIERVRERNHLTQRLMLEVGMSGIDLTIGVNGRIVGEKNREYILVRNDGVEGGWALGVVSKDKDIGKEHHPIDVDAQEFQFQTKGHGESEDDDDFEDVPVEGLNRLPGLYSSSNLVGPQQTTAAEVDEDDTLFVGSTTPNLPDDLFGEGAVEESYRPHPEEEDDINKAIAMSLKAQYGIDLDLEAEAGDDTEQTDPEKSEAVAPKWKQRTAEAAKPISGGSGRIVAHIVNNRSTAAVRRQGEDVGAYTKTNNESDSDSDIDFQATLAKSRRENKKSSGSQVPKDKNPFDGPLPFPKLSWAPNSLARADGLASHDNEPRVDRLLVLEEEAAGDDHEAGGFVRDSNNPSAPRPLPPWLAESTDIRDAVRNQQVLEQEVNAADRELALERARELQGQLQQETIAIESSSDDESVASSDVELIEVAPVGQAKSAQSTPVDHLNYGSEQPNSTDLDASSSGIKPITVDSLEDGVYSAVPASPEPDFEDIELPGTDMEIFEEDDIIATPEPVDPKLASPEIALEGVELTRADSSLQLELTPTPNIGEASPEPEFEDVQLMGSPRENLHSPLNAQDAQTPLVDDDDLFGDGVQGEDGFDEFSDPEEEELLERMAQEAEEHARFASELNQKSTTQNLADYDRELRQLRSQQKKDRRDADEVTQTMITECQALLRLFGIPYITAPMEAEAQCAELVSLGLVDGIITDDSDIFLFGGTRVYKNMFNTNKFVECYLGSDLETELSLGRDQLIALAQLLGSDYTEGLSGVGPVTSVEIISEFPGTDGLEKFQEWWQDVQTHGRPKEADASSPFRRKFRKAQAKKLFLPPGFPSPAVTDAYLHPHVDDSTEPFQWGVPDVEGLRRFLMATIGWSQERTDEVLVPVIRDMNKRDIEGTQANITRYFSGGVGTGAKEAFAPRQRVGGSKRMAEAVSRLRGKAQAEASGDPEGASSAGKRKRGSGARTEVTEDAGEFQASPQTDNSDSVQRVTRTGRNGKRTRGS